MKIFYFFICVFSLFSLGAQEKYALESAVFYLKHTGGDLNLELAVAHPKTNYGPDSRAENVPAALATLYSPEEKAVKDFYWRDDKEELKKQFQYKIPNAAKGIWQFRITLSRGGKLEYTLNTENSPVIGILPARSWVWHKDALRFNNRYFMVPTDNRTPLELYVSNCTIEILDKNGNKVDTLDKGDKKITLKPGEIYQMKHSTKSPNWNWFGAGGFPVIFCPSAEYAKELNASRIPLADGSSVALRFQKRADEWKKTLKKVDLEVTIPDLNPLKEKFLADPQSKHLFGITGLLSAAPYLLSIQNIDPASPDFGSAPRYITPLAFLYTLNKPYNPYYKNKAILNRVALYCINSFAKQRAFHENGTLYGSSSNYAGADGMYMVPESIAFLLLSPDLKPEVRELWGEALAYPLRRFFSDRVSCENQSVHWPVKLYAYAKAAGNPLFQMLAEDFVKNLNSPAQDRFIRTGYLQEAYGPDATYQGLGASLLAFYAHFSNDQNAYDVLNKIYTLMNHTVAPEPDGSVFGPSGFSHRTMGGWYIKQYGGGTRLVANRLMSAAVWHQAPEKAWSAKDFDHWIHWISSESMKYYKQYHYTAANYSFAPFSAIWYTFPEIAVKQGAKLPAAASENFDRSFGDEFHFARRKGYYAGVYTGKTAGKHTFWAKHDTPYSCQWNEKDGVMTSVSRKIFSPLPGMQLFWTPEYGTSLVSMNWNLYTHWNIRAEKDGKADWVDYFTSSYTVDPATRSIVMTQKFRKLPLTVKRSAVFENDKLTMSRNVEGDTKGVELIEQLPYLEKNGIRVEFRVNGKWEANPGGKVEAIRWINSKTAGTLLTFAYPHPVKRGKTYLDQNVKITSLYVIAGSTLNYTLTGF